MSIPISRACWAIRGVVPWPHERVPDSVPVSRCKWDTCHPSLVCAAGSPTPQTDSSWPTLAAWVTSIHAGLPKGHAYFAKEVIRGRLLMASGLVCHLFRELPAGVGKSWPSFTTELCWSGALGAGELKPACQKRSRQGKTKPAKADGETPWSGQEISRCCILTGWSLPVLVLGCSGLRRSADAFL